MSHISEEPLQILLITITVVPVINRSKRLFKRKVICVFNIALHLICLLLQIYLFVNYLGEGSLYAHRKEISSMNFIVRPLGSCSSEISVFAGEEHLQEIVVVELIVTIQIEVCDELGKIEGI